MNEPQTVNIRPGEMHIGTALRLYDALDKVGKAEFISSLNRHGKQKVVAALRNRKMLKQGMPDSYNGMCI